MHPRRLPTKSTRTVREFGQHRPQSQSLVKGESLEWSNGCRQSNNAATFVTLQSDRQGVCRVCCLKSVAAHLVCQVGATAPRRSAFRRVRFSLGIFTVEHPFLGGAHELTSFITVTMGQPAVTPAWLKPSARWSKPARLDARTQERKKRRPSQAPSGYTIPEKLERRSALYRCFNQGERR